MSFAEFTTALTNPVTLVLAAAAKGAVLIALAFVATHLLRHRSAAVRHSIWATAVAGHLVLLFALPLVPRVDVPVLPAIEWKAAETPGSPAPTVTTETIPAGDATPTAVIVERSAPAAIAAERSFELPSGRTLVISLWLLGAMFVFARYVVGTARVARLARESERVADGNWLSLVHRMAISMGIARPLTLVRGTQLDVPVTWGILYPVVFLPAGSDEWAEERQRFVLVHELAHVKRLDAVTQLLTQVAVALFWFDPLVWYAAARIRTERERACDDQVILHGVRPSLYADELLEMVRGMAPRRSWSDPAPAFAALAMARRSEFEGRMLAILDPRAPRSSLSRTARLATVAAALLLVAPLAAFHPISERTQRSDEPAALAPSVLGVDQVPAAQLASAEEGTASAASLPSMQSPPAAPGAPASQEASGPPAAPDAPPPPAATTPAETAARKSSSEPMYSCRAANLNENGQQTSIHSHGETGQGGYYTEALVKSRGYCATGLLFGNVTLSRDLTDVTAMAPGARAVFHELTPGLSRELVITAGAGGTLERRYLENGSPGDPARGNRWLADLLRGLVLKGGFGVSERVPHLRASGGVGAVLEEASRAPSSGVKRAYLVALLKTSPKLTAQETDRVVTQAAAEVSSSGDLRSVLDAALKHGRPSAAAMSAAISRVTSDGDKRAVLRAYLRSSPDAATMRAMLRAVETIDSDGDKSAVLVEAAPFAFVSPDVRSDFYAVTRAIGSDGDKRRVLTTALRHSTKDAAAVRQFLETAGHIGSDGDKSAVLLAAISAGMVNAQTRDAFLETATTIGSDGDKSRVLMALLR